MTKKEIDKIIFALLQKMIFDSHASGVSEAPKTDFVFDFQDKKITHKVVLN